MMRNNHCFIFQGSEHISYAVAGFLHGCLDHKTLRSLGLKEAFIARIGLLRVKGLGFKV